MFRCPSKGFALAGLCSALACVDDVTQIKSSEHLSLSIAPENLRDVPELKVDFPPEPRTWELSDSALKAALQAVGGRAFVGLKSTDARTLAATRRMEIVPFRRSPVARGVRAAISIPQLASAIAAVQQSGATIARYFDALGIAMVTIDPELAPRLRTDPHVDFLEPVDTSDRVITVESRLTASRRVSSHGSSALVDLVPSNIDTVKAPLAWPYSTGSGARLLIIDTGHKRGHPDLPLVPVANCSLGMFNACIDNGPNVHGTAVSGMALALQNGIGVVGVAPGTSGQDVFYWGACGGDGHCDGGEIVAALNWSVSYLGPRGVINASIAGTCGWAKATAVAAAYNAGHVLVAAVGNEGQNSVNCIAWYSDVIAVAGIKPDKTFAIPAPVPECTPGDGSDWGDHVDVVAPYWAQLTTVPSEYFSGNDYWGACGTSIATPMVAGTALLVRARYPTWANWQVRQRIIETTEPLGPPGWDDHFGWGLVRAHLATAFDPPALTPSVVSSRAKLDWQPIPFAVSYEVYFSITPTACPDWQLFTTTTGTTVTVNAPTVSSYWGTAPPYGQTALNLYVVGVAADGTKTKSSSASFLTVSSNPPC